MSRASRWWVVFGLCNVVVALALIWVSRVVIELERSERRARIERDEQESLRLAMWRMDSWVQLLLAREAGRPEGVAEPLPEGAEPFVQMHFRIDAAGNVTSPQSERLDEFRPYLTPANLRAAVAGADALLRDKLERADASSSAILEPDGGGTETLKSVKEFDARVACAVPRPPGSDPGGRQVVAWLSAGTTPDRPALAFIRVAGDGESFAGYVLDWDRISERLLVEIRDLFPNARLERVAPETKPDELLGRSLANLPVALVTDAPEPVAAPWITGGRAALALAWLATLLAVVAVGATLRKSIELGERRRRFVAAVTHELRTPLTTFQLYSEMLADGMVQDETQRHRYLQTLKEESQRLSAMVAHVLTHARLEGRRAPRQVERTTLGALMTRLRSPLERLAASAKLALEVETGSPADTPLTVDPAAIGQILGNLVDNAVKYSCGPTPARIRLAAATNNGSLILTVRDHGPGVPREQASAIFAPFERGFENRAGPVPGVGLGLALARGLAREMGGDVTLENPAGGGALFRLEVPANNKGRG